MLDLFSSFPLDTKTPIDQSSPPYGTEVSSRPSTVTGREVPPIIWATNSGHHVSSPYRIGRTLLRRGLTRDLATHVRRQSHI